MTYHVQMLGWVIKSGVALAGVSGMALVAGSGQAQMSWVASHGARAVAQFANTQNAPQNLLPPASNYQQPQMVQAVPQYDPLSATIDQWRRLQQSDNLAFSDYANFMLAHPGWPGETSRRAAAETAPDSYGASPQLTVRFFDRFPPVTAAGHVRYADALSVSGQTARAYEQARKAWRRGVLRPQDESRLMSAYSGALGPDDHDARMDMLLWQGATTAAARQISWTSTTRRPIFDARLAYRTKAADAATRGAAVEAYALNDAGFLADRASWYRDNGASGTARAQLARPHAIATPPTSAEKWYEVLLINARAAAADRQYSIAFDIARQVDDAYPPATDVATRPLGERDDYTSLTWLAGTVALNDLGRPRDAVPMFERYSRGSKTPTTQSKGLYWAGRAAEAAGDRSSANGYYARAAAFSDLYYGQLSAERIGQQLRRPAPINTATVDPATRSAFETKETVARGEAARPARALAGTGHVHSPDRHRCDQRHRPRTCRRSLACDQSPRPWRAGRQERAAERPQ